MSAPFNKGGGRATLAGGFTLIEILIALVIFAIMGVLAAMSLHSIIRTREQLKKSDHQLLQLQITMTLLRRDMSQAINRNIRDANGNEESAFSASSDGDIVFTRAGLTNPFDMNRQSDMQRVGYKLQGDKLVRLTWDVLDQAPHSQPESQTILSNVQSLQWQFIGDNGTTSLNWPPASKINLSDVYQSPLPKVVLLVVKIKNEGILQGVFPIPARGNYAL